MLFLEIVMQKKVKNVAEPRIWHKKIDANADVNFRSDVNSFWHNFWTVMPNSRFGHIFHFLVRHYFQKNILSLWLFLTKKLPLSVTIQ